MRRLSENGTIERYDAGLRCVRRSQIAFLARIGERSSVAAIDLNRHKRFR